MLLIERGKLIIGIHKRGGQEWNRGKHEKEQRGNGELEKENAKLKEKISYKEKKAAGKTDG